LHALQENGVAEDEVEYVEEEQDATLVKKEVTADEGTGEGDSFSIVRKYEHR